MMQVSALSLWLAAVSVTYWVVYFQYYWFPQLRPQPFTGFCFLMGLIYASLVVGIRYVFHGSPSWLSALPAFFLIGTELALLGRDHWRSIPAFFDVTILVYLMTEFVDTASISITVLLTNVGFAASLKGTVTELVFDNIVFALLIIALMGTQAPMENLIRAVQGEISEYFFLCFMLCVGIVYMMFEYVLQLLNWTATNMLFLATVSGTLMIGLSLSTYMLVQTHLQHNHARSQRQQQAFQEQFTTELTRQMQAVRKFRHDYQNMLLGLGGYLQDHDYAGFRQLYIDIRSGWKTSDAADLTLDDLTNMPRGPVRYALYHDYLLAQRRGVDLFVKIPQPLTATVVVGRRVGKILQRTLPPLIEAVAPLQPAMVTLKITEVGPESYVQITFPVPDDVQVVGQHSLVGPDFRLDLTGLLVDLPDDVTSQLRIKLHWGQLLVILPLT
ncbi:hypothetical protein [Levilactobacillus spicheri]|uniref:Signal transduction protein n=2 Tax=Levilactobacillus spicheri TaxID=216463 RepID=A0ABQ0WRF4_9LACO|nr:hypothetical protein [Levilactobacillus spicheri]GEO67250.1 hypothetical protein LSP04_16690 [Levilactobacillus spicheri]